MARILIVDDSAVMRLNLRKILMESGHEVVAEAPNGKVALNLYEKHKPDLVTMDITMPVMSGVDATGFIVSKYPDAKIVMISALNQKKMVYDALKNGARHYIIKPIDKNKVMSVLNEVLLTEESHIQKYEEKHAEKAAEELENKDHFSIENIDGIFYVKLGFGFNNRDMENLNTAMQGIMFVKPLSLRFDFADLDSFDDGYLNRIMVYAKKAIDSGGDYDSIVKNDSLLLIVNHKEETYLK